MIRYSRKSDFADASAARHKFVIRGDNLPSRANDLIAGLDYCLAKRAIRHSPCLRYREIPTGLE